jgi:DNA-binding GntR family transcriptional regulator
MAFGTRVSSRDQKSGVKDGTMSDRMEGAPLPNRLPERPKLGEEATRYLRDALVSGAFQPGQRMAVEELAHQLGVSAMPVREALVALANEGLLEVLPRRGFRVARIRRRDIVDVFRVHAFVAGLLAEAAAPIITPETIGELRRIQAEVDRLSRQRLRLEERSAQVEELNFLFHRTINQVADADRLRWFLRAATRYVPRHFYESIPGWLDTTLHDHPEIIAALAAHDVDRAREISARHVAQAGELVVAHLTARGMWHE